MDTSTQDDFEPYDHVECDPEVALESMTGQEVAERATSVVSEAECEQYDDWEGFEPQAQVECDPEVASESVTRRKSPPAPTFLGRSPRRSLPPSFVKAATSLTSAPARLRPSRPVPSWPPVPPGASRSTRFQSHAVAGRSIAGGCPG